MKNQLSSPGLSLSTLAWLAALLPFVTTHVSYLVAAANGHVEWCVPYWDSCTSISATGRQLPEKLWFKAGMIPAALATMALWWSAVAWRRQAGPTLHITTLRVLPHLGTFAAVMLVLYTVALGEPGDAYQLLRRIGVILSFALTYLAQLLFTRLVGELAVMHDDNWLATWHRQLFRLSALLLAIGMLSVALGWLMGSAYNAIEDAFEWVMALLLNLYFAGLALMWKKTGPVLHVRLQTCTRGPCSPED